MPAWPRPRDVVFDHAAAADAVAALQNLHSWFTDGSSEESNAAATALSEWEGHAATTFRSTHTDAASDKAQVAGAALTMIRLLNDAIEDAVLTQISVDQRQDDWDRQAREEAAAESQIPEGAS